MLNEDVKPGDDMAKVIGADDHVVEFEIPPNRPDCLSVIGLAREASATFGRPLKLHTPEVKGCGGSIAELVDIDRSHISAIELGNVGVSLDVIFRLCEVLEITPKELFDFR